MQGQRASQPAQHMALYCKIADSAESVHILHKGVLHSCTSVSFPTQLQLPCRHHRGVRQAVWLVQEELTTNAGQGCGRRGGACLPERPLSWLSMRRDSCRSVPTTCKPPSAMTSPFSCSATALYSLSIACTSPHKFVPRCFGTQDMGCGWPE